MTFYARVTLLKSHELLNSIWNISYVTYDMMQLRKWPIYVKTPFHHVKTSMTIVDWFLYLMKVKHFIKQNFIKISHFINENSSKMKISEFLFICMVYAAQWQPNSESSPHTGTMIGNSATITLEENLLLKTQNKSKRQHRHELEKWQMWCYSLLV